MDYASTDVLTGFHEKIIWVNVYKTSSNPRVVAGYYIEAVSKRHGGGGGVTSIIKVYTDVRLEWGILFRPPSI